MLKKAFLSLSICISLISVSGASFAETSADTASYREKFETSGKNFVDFLVTPANAAETGACIYTTGPTQTCKDGVTEAWCKQQPNYQWASNTKCP